MCFGALIVNPVLDIAETIPLSLLYLFSKGGKAPPLFCNGIKYFYGCLQVVSIDNYFVDL